MLEDLKEHLKITWDDEDKKLNKLIQRGKDYLNDLAGVELDFESETSVKSLLLDYCRYSYNNATEYFEENFKRDLLRLQLKSAVSSYENKE